MKSYKYRVYVQEVITNAGWVEVDAPNPERAAEMIEDGEHDYGELEPQTIEVTAFDTELIEDVEPCEPRVRCPK